MSRNFINHRIWPVVFLLVLFKAGKAQINEKQLGSWWMYFFSHHQDQKKIGFQGDFQLRNWGMAKDLEQLMLRGGISYSPIGKKWKFTQGLANITTGAFGESNSTFGEYRIYQEFLVPSKWGQRLFFNHRIRFEERFVDQQDFKTRFRYNLFLNIPLSPSPFADHSFYMSFYNELFLIPTKETFDRNRLYAALGKKKKKGLKTQIGLMQQSTSLWTKSQLQISLHQNF